MALLKFGVRRNNTNSSKQHNHEVGYMFIAHMRIDEFDPTQGRTFYSQSAAINIQSILDWLLYEDCQYVIEMMIF